jgi:hypothetical protein
MIALPFLSAALNMRWHATCNMCPDATRSLPAAGLSYAPPIGSNGNGAGPSSIIVTAVLQLLQ